MNMRVFLILGLLLTPLPATGRTWHILEDGSGDAPTIQAGIDSSAVGDTVLVGAGTYPENISFLGKDICVKGSTGPALTVIDAGALGGTVVTFASDESRSAVLEGFTIKRGVRGIFVF